MGNPRADDEARDLILFSGPCDATSARAVRDRIALIPRDVLPQLLMHDCQLVASELVSNAFRARSDWIDVDLLLFGDYIELRVRDEAAGVPELQDSSDSDPGGRGLAIVEAITSAWGYRAAPDHGKTVWARLNLPD